MPTTKIQKMLFMLLTALISVIAFVIYNIALSQGKMSNQVFSLALKEVPLEFFFAVLIQVSFAGKLAQKLALRIVNPEQDRPLLVTLTMTCMNIMIMCPSMSLLATILYHQVDLNLAAHWLEKIVFNFPFAFFAQIFLIGPLVRWLFRMSLKLRSDSSVSS